MNSYEPHAGDTASRVMNTVLKDLERENKLPPGYLTSLKRVDTDWDYFVKLALILEALLTRAIVLESGDPASYDSTSKMSQGKRLQRAGEYALLDEVERKMLFTIAMVRNDFVHQLENLTRPLSAYFLTLPAEKRDEYAKSILAAGIPGQLRRHEDPSAIEDFTVSFRETVLQALFPTLLKLGYAHGMKQKENAYVAWRALQEKKLGRSLPPRANGYLADRVLVFNLLAEESTGD